MILIDGNMLAHRAFHKMDFLKNSKGVHTGMEFGFLRSIESLKRKFPEHKIIICFDTKNNRKRDACARYKANRSKMKDTFYQRLRELQKFLSNFWDLAWQDGEEADDVMYTLAQKRGKKVTYLYSNDNDLLQCVTDKIFVLKSHESTLYIWDEDKVEEKYGVPPGLLVLFRSFVGDKSDNLDGVPRIQKKILADAIHHAIRIMGPATVYSDPEKVADHLCFYTSWSTNMAIKIADFVSSGLWAENYELMRLVKCEVTVTSLLLNEEHVIAKLQEWEIGSLDLCKKYAKNLVSKESEF